jgi:hypothetical protein
MTKDTGYTINTAPSLSDQPPFQHNYFYKGSTIHWNGSDQLELYKKNMQKSSTRILLQKHGWINSDIEYSYNSHGFRCPEFDNTPCALALGCSFTEGTGLHLYQAWPYRLSTILNFTVWNLGSGGGSIDTVFRILEHYINRLNTKYIFLLLPPVDRLEYCNIENGFPIIHPSQVASHHSFAKEWLSQSFNGIYNTKKTLLAIEQLCAKANIPLFTYCSKDALFEYVHNDNRNIDFARDLMHPGVSYQEYVANIMYSKFQSFNKEHHE